MQALDEHNEVLPNLGPGPPPVVLPQQTRALMRHATSDATTFPHWFITLSPTSRTLTGMDEHNEVLPLPPQEILAAESWRSTPCSQTFKYLYKYLAKGGGWLRNEGDVVRSENHRKRKRGEFEMGGSC